MSFQLERRDATRLRWLFDNDEISLDDHSETPARTLALERVFDFSSSQAPGARVIIVCGRYTSGASTGRFAFSIQHLEKPQTAAMFYEPVCEPVPNDPGFKRLLEDCARMGLEGQHNDLILAVLIQFVYNEPLRR